MRVNLLTTLYIMQQFQDKAQLCNVFHKAVGVRLRRNNQDILHLTNCSQHILLSDRWQECAGGSTSPKL